MNFAPYKDSFTLIRHKKIVPQEVAQNLALIGPDEVIETPGTTVSDSDKRRFLQLLTVAGLGFLGTTMLPKRADALVLGGETSAMGVKDSTGARINPAKLEGLGVTKKTFSYGAGNNLLYTPTSGKAIRLYSTRFSLSADGTSVSFRFTSGGTDFEIYSTPKAGGLYGARNHPNYVQGNVNEALYCNIVGSTTVQINIDYTEV